MKLCLCGIEELGATHCSLLMSGTQVMGLSPMLSSDQQLMHLVTIYAVSVAQESLYLLLPVGTSSFSADQ